MPIVISNPPQLIYHTDNCMNNGNNLLLNNALIDYMMSLHIKYIHFFSRLKTTLKARLNTL